MMSHGNVQLLNDYNNHIPWYLIQNTLKNCIITWFTPFTEHHDTVQKYILIWHIFKHKKNHGNNIVQCMLSSLLVKIRFSFNFQDTLHQFSFNRNLLVYCVVRTKANYTVFMNSSLESSVNQWSIYALFMHIYANV